jgi:hypothetical protein
VEHHREQVFLPNSLWGVFLIAGTIVRKQSAVIGTLTKGSFCINVSTCGPEFKGDWLGRGRSLQDKSPLLNFWI